MNKQEKIIVALLFAVLLGWFVLQDRTARERAEAMRLQREREATLAPPPERSAADPAPAPAPAPDETTVAPAPDPALPASDPVAAPDEDDPLPPERFVSVSNEVMTVRISSRGGAVVGVDLRRFSESLDPDSGPVSFDFSDRPALAIGDVAELSVRRDFSLSAEPAHATAEREFGDGLRFVRTYALTNGYQVLVRDTFRNDGEHPAPLPGHTLGTGAMEMTHTSAKVRGQSFLELNALGLRSGSPVLRWREKDFSGMLGARSSGMGCGRPSAAHLDETGTAEHREPLAWGSAKNRFFVQILAPEDGSSGCRLHVARDPDAQGLEIATVSLDMLFPETVLAPGAVFQREIGYYIGPSKYSELQALGRHQDRVMFHAWRGWGWFRTLSIGLLWVLNRIYDVLPNYGVAIILLTILVRIVFWPITRRSAADMKKMQELKPLMTQIREKHKDNPRRIQEETMALYRKHKVNPMTSCLPMFVQMPVFIALFNVLRGAVELRFASFLWISDLSEPERLLEGVLPFGLVLNILPLLMTVTTFFQQKMTPTGGDPAQQRMMMFMPVFMLFIFYNFPSALALYWTVSQALAILQMVGRRKRENG